MAMDKTQVDTYGRLQMEPLTMSHGLLKHSIRSKHMAMRILGYICHSPAHQPNFKGGVVRVSEPPTDLPPGTVVGRVPLKPIPNVSWSTYLLNEMHLQIEFILEQSGFLDLQRNGFHWKLHYNEKVYPVVMHPYIPFIIGDTEGHDRLCGHYSHRTILCYQAALSCLRVSHTLIRLLQGKVLPQETRCHQSISPPWRSACTERHVTELSLQRIQQGSFWPS
jgi:hypothetical protein